MPDGLTKGEFDTGIKYISDKLESLNSWMQKLEDHVSKIECNSNLTTERVVRLETEYKNLEKAVAKYEGSTEQTFKDAFEKMRHNKSELDNALRSISDGVQIKIDSLFEKIDDKINSKVENANLKQNILIITKTMAITATILSLIFTGYKLLL